MNRQHADHGRFALRRANLALAIGGGVLATGALVVGLALAVPDVEGEVTGSAGPATITETSVSTTTTTVTRTTELVRSAPQKHTPSIPERTVTVTTERTVTVTKEKGSKKPPTPKTTTKTTGTSAPKDKTTDPEPPPPCSPPLCGPPADEINEEQG